MACNYMKANVSLPVWSLLCVQGRILLGFRSYLFIRDCDLGWLPDATGSALGVPLPSSTPLKSPG